MVELHAPDDGWPHLIWVEPPTRGNGGFMAIVDEDRCDLTMLDWRQRAMLRASAQRVLDRLDDTEEARDA